MLASRRENYGNENGERLTYFPSRGEKCKTCKDDHLHILGWFFLISCATGQSVQKEPEKIAVQSESSEKYEAKYDALLEKIESIGTIISGLRSEVANLGYRLNHVSNPSFSHHL